MHMPPPTIALDAITRPTADVLKAAATLGDREVRYIVDAFYQLQDYRKATTNQIRSIDQDTDAGKTHATLDWLLTQLKAMEGQIERAMGIFAMSRDPGRWLMAQYGIGPVLSAGLLSHIDITKAPTAGHIWRYAGLDPTQTWTKRDDAKAWIKEHGVDIELAASAFGRRADTLRRMATTNKEGKEVKLSADTLSRAMAFRPFNASFKVLAWKVGQSMMKFSNREDCYYGKLYRERKAYEVNRNEQGGNAEAAAKMLGLRPNHAQKAIYATGVLPPGQIDARARRWVVKLFLAHLHEVMYRDHFGKAPPLPYAIAMMGHAHIVPPPGGEPQ